MRELIAIDLCCGAGGWGCAARGLPIRIGLAVDLWDVACTTYRLNHPQTQVLCADIRKSETQEAVKHFARSIDPAQHRLIVLGGIPCEWLSSYRNLVPVEAAKRESERATLDAALALAQGVEPRWWCLEDVKQIVKELPILTPWREINSQRYSAQRRKRAFVGDFPQPELGECTQVLADKIRPGPYRIGRRLLGRTPQTHGTFTKTATLGAWLDRKGPTVLTTCSRRDAEIAIVDDSLPGGMRNIEWQESAVLQGFPEDYLFYGSPSDVMKQIGQAVQIDTGRAILRAMCRAAGLLPASAQLATIN